MTQNSLFMSVEFRQNGNTPVLLWFELEVRDFNNNESLSTYLITSLLNIKIYCNPVKWNYFCCSFTQSCPTLCDPIGCSTPGFPVHHQLQELAQTCPLSQWCHPTISSSVVPFFSCLQSLPASGSFPMIQLFAWGGQSIGISASASVLPMNTQDWSPLGWTCWISLHSKGLERVFSNTTVQKHQFFGAQISLWSTLTSVHDYWKNHSLDYMDFCWQSDVTIF